MIKQKINKPHTVHKAMFWSLKIKAGYNVIFLRFDTFWYLEIRM